MSAEENDTSRPARGNDTKSVIGNNVTPLLKNYVFKIIASQVTRKDTITAASKQEAEEIMFERYGDLPYELIEIKNPTY